MPRIQQLPPHVVAQIAAGEVIERPAAVLKELVENAIDAGATRIDVAVGQGGNEYLRVVDNGRGMPAAELPLALLPHATSKLRSLDDLRTIGTLGFRGEGLASVAAVSQLMLQSRPTGESVGAEVRSEGGIVSDVRVWNGASGTRVEARNLFFNTPVRRKFLRGPSVEMSHVAEMFTRLALSNLSHHLTLTHNNRSSHDVPASAGLLDRVGMFFGDEVRKRLIAVEGDGDGMTIGGYVADPMTEAAGTSMQYLFVNGRWVRDRVLSGALQEAYRGLLLTGKHPMAFLFLELSSDDVDVNVHPAKSEVRFRQPDLVHQLVRKVVEKHLRKSDLVAPLAVKAVPRPEPPPPPELPFAPPAPPRRSTPVAPRPTTPAPVTIAPEPSKVVTPAADVATAVQMHDMYLVIEEPDGILIVDQHALHERILYEQLKARLGDGPPEVQRLLIPEPVRFAQDQAAALLTHRVALAGLGLLVDDFGGGTVLLTGYPAMLGKRPPRDILRAVGEFLTAQDAPPTREALLNDLLALMACHSAVRAGDRLRPDEIRDLVAMRHVAKDSHHCPHGRPSSLKFTRGELDRQFRRTG